MISVESKGSLAVTEAFVRRMTNIEIRTILNKYGTIGVNALSSATPKDSGRAASSWNYTIRKSRTGWEIAWGNSDEENGFPVAVMIQYGYGTGTGGYVQGRDYINPALKPIFDQIAKEVWEEVTRT